MEFSKKLLYFSWTITLILTGLLVYGSLVSLPLDGLLTVTSLAWAETGVSTGYYYWKAKNENRAKYAQVFLKHVANEWGVDTAVRMAEIVLQD